MRYLLIIWLFVAAAGGASADLVELRAGKKVTGKIVDFRNMMFEVILPSGEVGRYAVAEVQRVQFESSSVLFDTTTKGRVDGSLKGFENGVFTVLVPGKGEESVPAVIVRSTNLRTATATAGYGNKMEKINSAGARVDVAKKLVGGKVTVVDFYADWCGPCRAIAPFLEKLAKDDADVYLRKVDIKEWGSPVAAQYNIRSIPRIEVYDRKGKLVGVASSGQQQIRELVNRAKAL